MDVYFQTEKCTVGYEKHPVVSNMNIHVNKGEIVTLIGPNGAGKSTILKSIARQLQLVSGVVYLQKENIHEMSKEALSKKMSIVFTERLHTEFMTCEEVVATGRYPYTGRFGILSSHDKKVVAEAMQLVKIDSFRNKDFTKISDGQRQRVMLARAICQEPDMILLDEPTSFLDVKHKLEFLSILQSLRDEKQLTVIMSLHELELAKRVSDRILCIKGNHIDRYGKPEEIFVKGYMTDLFDIEKGSFDEENSSMELEAPKGKPKRFVIGGAGFGRETYRTLQRKQIPFSTGILYENDLDYPVACALATKVISSKAFEPMKEETLLEAKKEMLLCEKVICCRKTFGTLEKENELLYHYAVENGMDIEME